MIVLRDSLVYGKSLFPCCFQNSLFIFDFWQLDYNVSLCVCLWIYLLLRLLGFLDLDVYFLPQIWEVLRFTASSHPALPCPELQLGIQSIPTLSINAPCQVRQMPFPLDSPLMSSNARFTPLLFLPSKEKP